MTAHDLQWVAMATSFTGLVGVYRKRAWGPLTCGVASTGWCLIALTTAQYPWSIVEAVYAGINFIIAARWAKDCYEDDRRDH